ncbi:MAG: hypothetical protein II714_03740 [Oscillospiraceae bacterium]|nr:hypothetical protein [Oscillospiraceae bacterium]
MFIVSDDITAGSRRKMLNASAPVSVAAAVLTLMFYPTPGTPDAGSVGAMEGRAVVITVFAEDATTSWDFTLAADRKTRDHSLLYQGMAADYLEKSAAEWGKEIEFVYNWETDPYLRYDAVFEDDLVYDDDGYDIYDEWEYIDTSLPDMDTIKKKYKADHVIYMFLFNTPPECEEVSNTRNYYEGLAYPYEVCNMFCHSEDIEECPSAYAHEMLHTFGAPDLYTPETEYLKNCGVTQRYVDYCAMAYPNDIMVTVYDEKTYLPRYDRITNEITEITAYYVGLTDHCDDVIIYGLDKSEFDRG